MRVALLTLLFALPATAAELSPELVGKIQHEQKKAQEKLAAANGNRKPSEMSTEERSKAIKDERAASKEILEKHGVDPKDFARYSAKMTPEQLKQAEQAMNATAAKEAAEKSAAASDQKSKENAAPTVQKGFSNDEPVELESQAGAAPVVEHGLPVDE